MLEQSLLWERFQFIVLQGLSSVIMLACIFSFENRTAEDSNLIFII